VTSAADDGVGTAGFFGDGGGDCFPVLVEPSDGAGGAVGVCGAVGPAGGISRPTSTIRQHISLLVSK